MAEDQWADIRGARLHFEQSGSGTDLIWGHGLSQSRANESALGLIDWEAVPALVLRYDARGHGLSETTPDLNGYSWTELALDQLALADHLGIGRYIAAGASMGCGTALHVAVAAPERVRKLVLLLPPTAWETRAAQAEMWEATAHVIETRGVEPIIAARAELAPPDPFVGDETRREVQADATRSWDPKRLAHVMRGAATADLPDRERLTHITTPALILAWTGDPVHPVSTAQALAELLPHSELHLASSASELSTWTARIAEFVQS